MTAHNSVFGWIHGFRINENNALFPSSQTAPTPYPPLIADPTVEQLWQNWNTADTGAFIFTSLAFTALSYRISNQMVDVAIIGRKKQFTLLASFSVLTGAFLGLRNSCYRLQGLVPNGLPARKVYEPIKYNYTSNFLKNSFWSVLFEPRRKPTQWSKIKSLNNDWMIK